MGLGPLLVFSVVQLLLERGSEVELHAELFRDPRAVDRPTLGSPHDRCELGGIGVAQREPFLRAVDRGTGVRADALERPFTTSCFEVGIELLPRRLYERVKV